MEIQKEEGKLLKKTTGVIIVLFRMTSRLPLAKLEHFHWVATMRVTGKLFIQRKTECIIFPFSKAKLKCQPISHRHNAPSEMTIIYYIFPIIKFLLW